MLFSCKGKVIGYPFSRFGREYGRFGSLSLVVCYSADYLCAVIRWFGDAGWANQNKKWNNYLETSKKRKSL
ncbi:hypothetical protein HMPREF3027_03545 [Porphyromonas sp. HMSC077F02]|nr:hypothetical protein HMPREF3027_03545 [Porphyromonas sp. HMSC077F02]